ncbi:hypothetical protein SO802_034685 [Lithocarpus litseifolius]|uniref:Aminotransferase-like plant mobile domain-containing protein n=1 Tax=Lithocarpus litseifolius TaxID=425828 RepID=A0AAW2BGP0_9ROSI
MDPHQQGPSIWDVLTRQDVHRSNLLWDAPLADERVPGVLTCRRQEKGLFEDGLLRVPNIDVDHALITALMERWRPETHSFHLPHGEMTITLQDMEVIMGVLVVGLLVVGFTRMNKWADLCAKLLGHRPPDREASVVGIGELSTHMSCDEASTPGTSPRSTCYQFGMKQGIPEDVDTSIELHKITLQGKQDKNWAEEHATHIAKWAAHATIANAPPFQGEMSYNDKYMVESQLRIMANCEPGSEIYIDCINSLQAVEELG